MKKFLCSFLMGATMFSLVNAQVYVNDMTKAEVEKDCEILGGVKYDTGKYYGDSTSVQKTAQDVSTSFTFYNDIAQINNKKLTGFIVNALFPNDRKDFEKSLKVEYSTDEETFYEVPDMKTEKSYDGEQGKNYWIDYWCQGALPAGTKALKVTLLANTDFANWIPCYRKTTIYYEGGDAYQYVKPTYLMEDLPTDFSIDFESDIYSIEMGGENSTSSAVVVENPLKDAVNGTDHVLKITQDPDSANWSWGNADWFGAYLGIKKGDDLQLTAIDESKHYLHFSIYRTDNSTFGLEAAGGTCTYGKHDIAFTGAEGWQEYVIDFADFKGDSYKKFFFCPNRRYGTDAVAVKQITYIDNIFFSENSTPAALDKVMDGSLVMGNHGFITVASSEPSFSVYNVTGAMVGQYILNGETNVTMEPGLYIVKVGETATKVIVY